MLDNRFFSALGKLTFAFASLEDLVGLCIAELLSNPRDESALQEVWDIDSFTSKLNQLKRDFATAVKRVGENFNEIPFDALLDDARKLARRRNDAIHGFLYVDRHTQGYFLKNRRFGGRVSVDPAEIDALTSAAQDLSKRFGQIRGECISLREHLKQLGG